MSDQVNRKHQIFIFSLVGIMVFSVIAASLFSVFGGGSPDFKALKVADITVGTGEVLTLGDDITFNYSLALKNGTKVPGNDTFATKTPISFEYKKGSLITGMIEGLKGMRVGGKRRLEIPSSMAYGPNGDGTIPANAGLIFVLELISIDK